MVVMVVLTLATVAFAESYKDKAQKYEHVEKVAATVHIVKKGDWVSKLAKSQYGDPKKYGNIVEVNALSHPDNIFPGDTLYVPVEPVVADTLVLPNGELIIGKKNNDEAEVGSLKVKAKAGAEVEAKTDSTTAQESEKSGKVYRIQGDQNQVFESGSKFYNCTFIINPELDTNTQAETTAKSDSSIITANGISIGAGFSYGENPKGMAVLVGQYRWGDNAVGLFLEWDSESLNDMAWRLSGFYRRYLWRNLFSSVSFYGGSRLDANDFRSWENVVGAGIGIGHDVELGKGWILNPEYQHRREMLFLPNTHAFGHDNRITLNLRKRIGGDR